MVCTRATTQYRHEPSLAGPRADLMNKEFDNAFLDKLIAKHGNAAAIPHFDYPFQIFGEIVEFSIRLG